MFFFIIVFIFNYTKWKMNDDGLDIFNMVCIHKRKKQNKTNNWIHNTYMCVYVYVIHNGISFLSTLTHLIFSSYSIFNFIFISSGTRKYNRQQCQTIFYVISVDFSYKYINHFHQLIWLFWQYFGFWFDFSFYIYYISDSLFITYNLTMVFF